MRYLACLPSIIASCSQPYYDMAISLVVSETISSSQFPSQVKIPLCLRPIALAPTLSKVFEWTLLIMYLPVFATSPLQFGFKPGLSTELCFNYSPVFGCFLDTSKANDRVDHCLLFEKLLSRNLPPPPPAIVRTVLLWYSEQEVSVLWNNTSSDKFTISNGVRQGGILSPILFTIYLDDLLLKLERAGVGCYWRHHFVGAI